MCMTALWRNIPFGRAVPQPQTGVLFQADERGRLYRLPVPLVWREHPECGLPGGVLPATIAHEFSHQRGVAAEQEANFVAIRASTTCGDAAYEYSGWLMGYLYLSNAWYSADPQAASENYRTLCDAARTDLADNNAYWAKWEGPVKEAGSTVYTGFLRGYDQTLGMKSYGACVNLLVEYYYPMAQGE